MSNALHCLPSLGLALLFSLSTLLAQTAEQVEFFEKKIRPVFAKNCNGCHNTKVKTAGLDMTTVDGFVHGGQTGGLVQKDKPEQSLLLRVLSYEGQLKMPPTGKLKDEDMANVTAWVQMGAPWPGAAAVSAVTPPKPAGRVITAEEKNFWAFRPVAKQVPPQVNNKGWVKSPIDQFILSKLEEKGLTPSAPASKAALLRRVTFNLTGLPPSEEEVKLFLSDTSAQAFEKVVDRLLASPRYGEKWGRHWLDVARYADSTGNDEDHRYPYAWRYRDYVIDAFNRDLPYDQFVKEQLAGDLLPSADGEVNRRGLVATGFLALGAKALAQQDKVKMMYDIYDEQVDVTSKAFMGVTLACARCHDHKFDPLLTKDYYSMVSIFASTKQFKDSDQHVSKLLFVPLVPEKQFEAYTSAVQKAANKAIEIEDLTDEEMDRYTSQLIPKISAYMVAARRVYAEGVKKEEAARASDLRPEVLQKWVDYLKPNGEARIYLEPWQAAKAENAAEIAKTYQTAVEKRHIEWQEQLKKWRATFRKMSAEMNMPPPPRPKFDAAKDRFFAETYFDGPLGVGKKERETVFSAEARTKLASLTEEHAQLKKALPPEPDQACAVQEGKAFAQKVFIRGDYNALGEPAPKAFPVVVAGTQQPPIETASGRLELANWLTKPENPLTARVMVNRIWQWHFGDGLVRTPDNFGKMGDRPTHPELLDYLAKSFVDNGWSVKSMHRLILLSSAYKMSSDASEGAVQGDPENRLLSRFPRRRLSVEEMRDGLLAVDKTIDLTVGGTLQSGFGTDGENSVDRLSIRPDSTRRRMVYLPLRRANLPSLLNLFDFGDATTPSGKRALTVVAPQALFMMNSEFIRERSKNLSSEVLEKLSDPTQRLRTLYLRTLNRQPEPEEVDTGLSFVTSFQTKFAGKRTEADAWFSLTRVLIASNEFIYVD
jgi:hypothetical protein